MDKAKRRRRLVGIVLILALLCVLGVSLTFNPVDRAVLRLKTDDASRDVAIARLAALKSADDIARLAVHLGDEDPRVRNGVIEALSRIGAPAIAPLITTCNSELATQPDRPSRMVFEKIRRALRLAGNSEGRIPTGGGAFYAVSAKAARFFYAAEAALSQLGPSAVESLTSMAGRGEYVVRFLAVKSLGRMPDPAVFEPLLALMSNPDHVMREAAANGLFNLKTAATAALNDLTLTADAVSRWRAYEEKDEAAVPVLLAALDNDIWRVSCASAHTLSLYLSDSAVLEKLLSIAGDRSRYIDLRREALKSLSRNEDPRALSVIVKGLGDGPVADTAKSIVAELPAPRRTDAIIRALSSDDQRTAYTALELFYKLHDMAIAEALIQEYRTADAEHKPAMRKALELVANNVTHGGEPEEDMKAIARIHATVSRDVYGQPTMRIGPAEWTEDIE